MAKVQPSKTLKATIHATHRTRGVEWIPAGTRVRGVKRSGMRTSFSAYTDGAWRPYVANGQNVVTSASTARSISKRRAPKRIANPSDPFTDALLDKVSVKWRDNDKDGALALVASAVPDMKAEVVAFNHLGQLARYFGRDTDGTISIRHALRIIVMNGINADYGPAVKSRVAEALR